MRKTYFTRKTLIALSFAFLFSFIFLFVGYCLTSSKNVVLTFAQDVFDYQKISGDGLRFIFVFLVLVALYVVVCTAAILYERRYAIVNGKKHYSPKMFVTYILTFLACFVLSFGVATLIDRIAHVDLAEAYRFIGTTLVVSLIIYVLVLGFIIGILLFVVNFILVDKPFRFFKEEELPIIDDALENGEEESDIQSNFDSTSSSTSLGAGEGLIGDTTTRKVVTRSQSAGRKH